MWMRRINCDLVVEERKRERVSVDWEVDCFYLPGKSFSCLYSSYMCDGVTLRFKWWCLPRWTWYFFSRFWSGRNTWNLVTYAVAPRSDTMHRLHCRRNGGRVGMSSRRRSAASSGDPRKCCEPEKSEAQRDIRRRLDAACLVCAGRGVGERWVSGLLLYRGVITCSLGGIPSLLWSQKAVNNVIWWVLN